MTPTNLKRSGPNLAHVHKSRRRRSAGKMGGSDDSHIAGIFFVTIYHTTFRQLHNGRFSPNLAVTRESMSLKNSVYRSFAAKQTHNGRGQTGILLSPADGPGTHCRDKLFISRCSPMVREFLRSVNFFVRRTVLELPGVKVPHFF